MPSRFTLWPAFSGDHRGTLGGGGGPSQPPLPPFRTPPPLLIHPLPVRHPASSAQVVPRDKGLSRDLRELSKALGASPRTRASPQGDAKPQTMPHAPVPLLPSPPSSPKTPKDADGPGAGPVPAPPPPLVAGTAHPRKRYLQGVERGLGPSVRQILTSIKVLGCVAGMY